MIYLAKIKGDWTMLTRAEAATFLRMQKKGCAFTGDTLYYL